MQRLFNSCMIHLKCQSQSAWHDCSNSVTDYASEGNSKVYRPLQYDPTSRHNEKIKDAVNRLVTKGSITQNIADYLVFTKPRTPSLYILPKMHKPARPPLGRPIISANQCPIERISGLIDHCLRPYVPLLKSYIRDSIDMIKKSPIYHPFLQELF